MHVSLNTLMSHHASGFYTNQWAAPQDVCVAQEEALKAHPLVKRWAPFTQHFLHQRSPSPIFFICQSIKTPELSCSVHAAAESEKWQQNDKFPSLFRKIWK